MMQGLASITARAPVSGSSDFAEEPGAPGEREELSSRCHITVYRKAIRKHIG